MTPRTIIIIIIIIFNRYLIDKSNHLLKLEQIESKFKG